MSERDEKLRAADRMLEVLQTVARWITDSRDGALSAAHVYSVTGDEGRANQFRIEAEELRHKLRYVEGAIERYQMADKPILEMLKNHIP